MTPSRIWTVGAIAAAVAVLGGAVGLGVQPQLAAASTADGATQQVDQANDLSQVELARLARLAAKQADLEAEDAAVALAVPRTLKLNTFSRQLRAAAALDGVQITSLTLGDPAAYEAPAGVAAPATTASSTTATPAPSATPAAAPATVKATGDFSKTDPRITGANFVVIPVTVIVSGDEASGLAFARDAQRIKRLLALSTVSFSRSVDASQPSSTTLSGNIYSLHR